jgi:hypothetical protein
MTSSLDQLVNEYEAAARRLTQLHRRWGWIVLLGPRQPEQGAPSASRCSRPMPGASPPRGRAGRVGSSAETCSISGTVRMLSAFGSASTAPSSVSCRWTCISRRRKSTSSARRPQTSPARRPRPAWTVITAEYRCGADATSAVTVARHELFGRTRPLRVVLAGNPEHFRRLLTEQVRVRDLLPSRSD